MAKDMSVYQAHVALAAAANDTLLSHWFNAMGRPTTFHIDNARSNLRDAAALLGFDLVPRKSSEASRADHEYRVLNGCEPPVTEATDKFDGRNSSRVDQPAAEGM